MKRDALVDSAQSVIGWLEEHRSEAILFSVILAVVVAVGVGSILFFQHRQQEAAAGFGAAMDIYSTPIAQPGAPAQPGVRTFPSSMARAQAANEKFVQVAHDFSSSNTGKQALYLSGLTYMEMGKTADAENALKKAMRDGNKNLSALAELALAGVYQQNGRTTDAIQLLKKLADHPTTTVPVGESKLELARIYEKTNPEHAKQIYAELKDKDSKTAAGQIAAQKLQQAQ